MNPTVQCLPSHCPHYRSSISFIRLLLLLKWHPRPGPHIIKLFFRSCSHRSSIHRTTFTTHYLLLLYSIRPLFLTLDVKIQFSSASQKKKFNSLRLMQWHSRYSIFVVVSSLPPTLDSRPLCCVMPWHFLLYFSPPMYILSTSTHIYAHAYFSASGSRRHPPPPLCDIGTQKK
jgi:hypothetical protein